MHPDDGKEVKDLLMDPDPWTPEQEAEAKRLADKLEAVNAARQASEEQQP